MIAAVAVFVTIAVLATWWTRVFAAREVDELLPRFADTWHSESRECLARVVAPPTRPQTDDTDT
jgi:hypothetical protein